MWSIPYIPRYIPWIFKELCDRYDPFDIAFIENGAYNGDCSWVHMFHCETVQANIDLKFEVLFPIHWSKLDLSINPQDEPIIRIIKKKQSKNFQYCCNNNRRSIWLTLTCQIILGGKRLEIRLRYGLILMGLATNDKEAATERLWSDPHSKQ